MNTVVERQDDRVSVSLTVVLDCSSGLREVRVSDLSLGGCYIDGLALVRPDEVVGLKLVLRDGRSENVSGTVTFVHEGIGFGLRFNDLDVQQRSVIEGLVESYGGGI